MQRLALIIVTLITCTGMTPATHYQVVNSGSDTLILELCGKSREVLPNEEEKFRKGCLFKTFRAIQNGLLIEYESLPAPPAFVGTGESPNFLFSGYVVHIALNKKNCWEVVKPYLDRRVKEYEQQFPICGKLVANDSLKAGTDNEGALLE